MSSKSLNLGKSGEGLAVSLLKAKGYKILERNYKTKLGEIDIVAQDNDTLCFIEVKTRLSDRCGLPNESVSAAKQAQISKAAVGFLKERNSLDKKARFDVISILYSRGAPKLDLLKNAFDLDERYAY